MTEPENPGNDGPPWRYRGLEPAWEKWIERDTPDLELQVTVWNWLMGLRDNPYAPSTAPIAAAGGQTWIGEAPGTDVVFLFRPLPDQTLLAIWLETV